MPAERLRAGELEGSEGIGRLGLSAQGAFADLLGGAVGGAVGGPVGGAVGGPVGGAVGGAAAGAATGAKAKAAIKDRGRFAGPGMHV